MNSTDDGNESRFAIGVVTRRTGLSPDVLRVWERRYGVVTPKRTAGGQRLYSAADVEKLRLLRRLVEAGHRIAPIAQLDAESLRSLASETSDHEIASPRGSEADNERWMELVDAAGRLDAVALDSGLRRTAMTMGTEAWIEELVAPFLHAVGEKWHEGTISPAHEHLATATTRDALAWVLRSFSPAPDAPTIVAATPSGERHELGAMMAAVAATEAGWNVQYLGADIPAKDLAGAVNQTQADAVALSLVNPGDVGRAIGEVRLLRDLLPAGLAIFVGGSAAVACSGELVATGVTVVPDTRAFRRHLSSFTPAS